jgi:hypothetical protein
MGALVQEAKASRGINNLFIFDFDKTNVQNISIGCIILNVKEIIKACLCMCTFAGALRLHSRPNFFLGRSQYPVM